MRMLLDKRYTPEGAHVYMDSNTYGTMVASKDYLSSQEYLNVLALLSSKGYVIYPVCSDDASVLHAKGYFNYTEEVLV